MSPRGMFSRDLWSELDRLQRDLHSGFETAFDSRFHPTQAIRGAARGGFPALNIGMTPEAIEVLAFAPGIDPATLDVHIDRGVLTVDGERAALPASGGADPAAAVTRHRQERFAGRFRRVISMPDDVDAQGVTADYRDGVLRIRLPRLTAPQPRRIAVQ